MLAAPGSPFLTEVEVAFDGAWSWVGFVDQLPRPEARFVFEAAGRSLLVCRDPAGRPRAFVNACSHRGTRLCVGPGQGRIRCPYHGWVFGCDGRLLGATRRAGLAPAADADLALRELPCREAGGLLFVREGAGDGQDLPEALGPAAAWLEALAVGSRRALLTFDVRVPGAWPLVAAEAPRAAPFPGLADAGTLPGAAVGPTVQRVAPRGLTGLLAGGARELERLWLAPSLLLARLGPLRLTLAVLPWTPDESRLIGRVAAWPCSRLRVPLASAWARQVRRHTARTLGARPGG